MIKHIKNQECLSTLHPTERFAAGKTATSALKQLVPEYHKLVNGDAMQKFQRNPTSGLDLTSLHLQPVELGAGSCRGVYPIISLAQNHLHWRNVLFVAGLDGYQVLGINDEQHPDDSLRTYFYDSMIAWQQKRPGKPNNFPPRDFPFRC